MPEKKVSLKKDHLGRPYGTEYEGRDMNGHLRIYTVGGDSWNAPCSVNCGCYAPDWNC